MRRLRMRHPKHYPESNSTRPVNWAANCIRLRGNFFRLRLEFGLGLVLAFALAREGLSALGPKHFHQVHDPPVGRADVGAHAAQDEVHEAGVHGLFGGVEVLPHRVGDQEELVLGPLNNLREYLSVHMGEGLLFYLAEGLIQGVGGGLGIVLPYFVPLLFLMSLLEDIGYLSRASFLMDTFMHKIGLHGNSVSAFILGFGCNVPAVVSTRILDSRRDKIITALLIPFVPCSARTTIILALVAFYLGPLWALGFYVFNILLLGVLGRIISLFFKDPSPGLILEIPTLKMPSMKNMARKIFIRLKAFVKFAWPILIAGSIVLALMQFFKFDQYVNLILSPLVEKALGLPQELGVTLIFGFLRKELSLVMMLQALGVSYQELMSVITYQQMIIFVVFISFFIPCLSTVAIIWKEIGRRIALLSVALNTSVAIVLSLVMRLILKL